MGNSNSTNIGDESSNPSIEISEEILQDENLRKGIQAKIIEKGNVSEINSIVEIANKNLNETLNKAKYIADEIEGAIKEATEEAIEEVIDNTESSKRIVFDIKTNTEEKIYSEKDNVIQIILSVSMNIIREIKTNKKNININRSEKEITDSILIDEEINKNILYVTEEKKKQ